MRSRMNSRTLKIEEHGDPYKGKIKPKIRLCGHWLERAGFRPGNHVNVRLLADGVIVLHSYEPSSLKLNTTET
jgi:hypothetical protein